MKTLTAAQLRSLTVGDRVSRLAGPGQEETAPVARITATQCEVVWPSGERARYWRESGRRAGCPGEVLRQAEPSKDASAWGEHFGPLASQVSAA
jgi:hypothetical protein